MASNFDHRLHAIRKGLSELSPLQFQVISAEVGWRKPDRRFFAAVTAAAGCEAREILFVGDSLENDYDGARAAGLRSVLFAGQTGAADAVAAIQDLNELL